MIALGYLLLAMSLLFTSACSEETHSPAEDATSDADSSNSGEIAFETHRPVLGSPPVRALSDILFQPGGSAVLLDPVDITVRAASSCTFESCNSRIIDDDTSYRAPVRVMEGPASVPSASIVVIDIGVLAPSDANLGQIGLYNQNLTESSLVGGEYYRPTSLHVEEAGSDSLKLLLAEFGNSEGALSRLDLSGSEDGWEQSGRTEVISEPGFSWIEPGDIDGDGDEDLVVSQAQLSETIRVFEREGEVLTPRVVFDSDDTYFGLSDIKLVDFDNDGDLDILFAHGDVLDFDIPDSIDADKYNGIDILENDGTGTFEHRELVSRFSTALIDVGDIDGDGDLDLVAGTQIGSFFPDRDDYYLIALFENRGESWTTHTLSDAGGFISSIQLRDMDGDGDLDIVATSLTNYAPSSSDPRLLMFENLRLP
jgi:hypothetical protein